MNIMNPSSLSILLQVVKKLLLGHLVLGHEDLLLALLVL